ncbi:acyl-CoA desaturase [Aminobacter sp. HY435]|uniref:acyl-CoA desaturase n=1 Tax=Aminobacter sp. HY435 TaxID=2970917 RepID=UPI0022B987C9|nr:fatty acid desaturase [Aminobacter sp. HY435]
MSKNAVATPVEDVARGRLLARIDWLTLSGLAFYHLVALYALLPWFFSWTGVFLCLAGIYVFGTLGINLCYHRLLTHRGFTCPKWLEHGLAVIAVCAFQDTPARWVAIHRRHHEHADKEPDPHSPIINFLWAHIGWLVVKSPDMERMQIYSRYAKDIVRDPFYRKLDKPHVYLGIILGSWAAFFFGGMAASLIAGQSAAEATQFGLSLLVWGVFVRTVIVWHITWSVNSVTHVWGYRNYETADDSTNNMVIGLLSNGEGWHNNHHADPRSARHGHRWWEVDVTYLSIRMLGLLGLADKIATPRRH